MTTPFNLPSALASGKVLTIQAQAQAEAIASIAGANDTLVLMPVDWWRQWPQDAISAYCVATGQYGIPTIELVEFLSAVVNAYGADNVLEIGAGNGRLAHFLGIKATDSFMQERSDVRALYDALKQAPVEYGANVLRLSAGEAVRSFKPHLVIGNWVTHKYNVRRHEAGGNAEGINEAWVIGRADYLHIGDQEVHKGKAIRGLNEQVIDGSGMCVSRAFNPVPVIWHWPGTTNPKDSA